MNSRIAPSRLASSWWTALCFLLCFILPLQAQESPAASPSLAAEAQRIAEAINQQRSSIGLAPLMLHALLNQAAQNHVNDMVATGRYGHVGSDGSYARQRIQRVGYSSGGWASENWVSATTPDQAMSWWMNDWIHRENILNPRWREVGIGFGVAPSGRQIYVTVFTAGLQDNGDNAVIASSAATPAVIPANGLDYTIQPGDTLIAIAVRYGLDWVVIAEVNRLSEESLLQIGQIIRLPGVQGVGGPVNAPPSAPIASTEPQTDAVQNSQQHIVQPGDTLLGVALRYGLTWQELAAANGLTEHDLLQIGQKLVLPGQNNPALTATTPNPALTKTARYHTVGAGETIISIALHYGLNWETLLRLNHLGEKSILQIGQQIRLE
jgi:LysM repeat protein